MSDDINQPLLRKLLLEGKSYKLPKGQLVQSFSDQNSLHSIETGFIKRYLITNDGKKSVQTLYGPGDIFPMTPLYEAVFGIDIYSGPEQYYYEAATALTIRSQDMTQILSALQANPLLYRDLFYAAGVRLNAYIHRLEDRSLRSSLYRIAHLLNFLGLQFGVQTADGITIQLPLTHQEISEMLDLTRETVSRDMAKLRERGIIDGTKNIVILNRERLVKLFGSDL
jgi:CRP/FNR family transcriptional regulator